MSWRGTKVISDVDNDRVETLVFRKDSFKDSLKERCNDLLENYMEENTYLGIRPEYQSTTVLLHENLLNPQLWTMRSFRPFEQLHCENVSGLGSIDKFSAKTSHDFLNTLCSLVVSQKL